MTSPGNFIDESDASTPSSSPGEVLNSDWDCGGGGGARKEANPRNWRVRVCVSSEMSSLTPLGGDWGSPAVSEVVEVEEGISCSSSSSSDGRRVFAIDLASHDILLLLQIFVRLLLVL